MKHHVSFELNGDPVEVLCDSEQTVLDVLRDEMQLIGTKEGCATCLALDGSGKITDARVSLGAVAARPLLVKECADAIIGTSLDDAAMAKLDSAAQAACAPINDKRGTIEYRTKVAGVLARRTARTAYDRARG